MKSEPKRRRTMARTVDSMGKAPRTAHGSDLAAPFSFTRLGKIALGILAAGCG